MGGTYERPYPTEVPYQRLFPAHKGGHERSNTASGNLVLRLPLLQPDSGHRSLLRRRRWFVNDVNAQLSTPSPSASGPSVSIGG